MEPQAEDPATDLPARAGRLARDGYGPLAIPAGQKQPPPVRTTGADPLPSYPDWAATVDAEPHRTNLGVRLPPGVVGIDVDAYDSKTGRDTWELLNGDDPLPATVVISARFGPGYDGISGIRLYQLPDSLAEGELWGAHGGVEIIRHRHRYLMAPGATHPSGTTYRAFDVRSRQFLDHLPTPQNLPHLSTDQAARLTKTGAPWSAQPPQPTLGGHDRLSLEALPPGPPCDRMLTLLLEATRDIENEDSRHDRMARATYAMVAAGAEGHAGASDALRELRLTFIDAIKNRAPRDEAALEYSRAVRQALEKIPPVDPMLQTCCGHRTPSLFEPTGDHGLQMAPEGTSFEPQALPTALAGREDIVRDSAAYRKLALDRAARRLLDSDEAATHWTAPALVRVADLLAEPDEPVEWRIEGLWPKGGKVLLSAAAKSGKTTLGLNLDRALTSGQPFLGHYPTEPIEGSVCVLDLEMTRTQLRTWYRALDHQPTDRIVLLPLRGRGQTLDLRRDQVRRMWADLLAAQDCAVLRLDPIGPVLAALAIDENDNGAVASYLAALDALTVELGADLFVSHHYGHSGRTRGASALLGWADALWDLTRKEETHTGDDLDAMFDPRPRAFRAEGRDVDVPERPLHYDPTTRELTAGPPPMSKRDKEAAELALALQILTEHGLVSARDFGQLYNERARVAGLRTSSTPRNTAYRIAANQLKDATTNSERYA